MKRSLIMPELSVLLENSNESPAKKYDTPEKFYKSVRDYIEMCHVQSREVETKRGIQFIEKPFTISGLCIFLGMSKQKFNKMSKLPQYSEICEIAKLISENYLEEGLLNGKLNPIGSIFTLKNHFGWKETKQESENKDVTINIMAGKNNEVPEAEIVNDDETIRLLEESGLNFDTPEGED